MIMCYLYNTIFILLICIFWINPSHSGSLPTDRAQDISHDCTITRIQKPLAVRTDRETLEYFIEHVEELTKQGKDFKKKDLILEVRGNGRYGIEMPSKRITGEFELVERQPQKAIYLGRGNAVIF